MRVVAEVVESQPRPRENLFGVEAPGESQARSPASETTETGEAGAGAHLAIATRRTRMM
jgi:hypothetical protein